MGGKETRPREPVNDLIRSLTNNPRLVGLARRFHVAAPLKSWEYRLRGPRDGAVHHVVAGVEIMLATPNATEFRTLEGCSEHEPDFVEALEKKFRSGGVFYDVGANVGQFLIAMAKIIGDGGTAIGFEPEPINYQRLTQNIKLNKLANARAFQLALSDRSGEIQIFGTRRTATIVPHAAENRQSQPTAMVRTARGDDLRQLENLPIPNAVKIDVEGAEFAALTGLAETLSNPSCELLCCEVHPSFLPEGVTPEMVLSLGRSLGFNCIETHQRGGEIHLIAKKGPE